MDYRHADRRLRRLDEDARYTGGWDAAVVKAFRRRMQMVRAARDERDFYALKSLHDEKLKGDRRHQRSMRLNDQWRLILEIESGPPPESGCIAVIVAIEDYH